MRSEDTEMASGRVRDEPIMPEFGWAIVEGNYIDVRTVSPTERAAKVKWLVVVAKQTIFASMTDDDINYFWNINAPRYGAIACEVKIEIRQP